MENIIIGGIIGFFVAVGKDIVTNYFQNKKAKTKFYQEKMEDIFILLDEQRHNTIQSNISNNETRPIVKFDNSRSKLEMLIQYYIPNIDEKLQNYLEKQAQSHNHVIGDTIDSELKKNDEEYRAYQELKKSIKKEAKRYI